MGGAAWLVDCLTKAVQRTGSGSVLRLWSGCWTELQPLQALLGWDIRPMATSRPHSSPGVLVTGQLVIRKVGRQASGQVQRAEPERSQDECQSLFTQSEK